MDERDLRCDPDALGIDGGPETAPPNQRDCCDEPGNLAADVDPPSERLRIYVAGPMSVGDIYDNVQRGIVLGREMFRDGLAPFIPHLNAYMTLQVVSAEPSADLDAMLDWDFAWVQVSDAVFRMPGESAGADREVALATSLGIPVFTDYAALLMYARTRNRLTG